MTDDRSEAQIGLLIDKSVGRPVSQPVSQPVSHLFTIVGLAILGPFWVSAAAIMAGDPLVRSSHTTEVTRCGHPQFDETTEEELYGFSVSELETRRVGNGNLFSAIVVGGALWGSSPRGLAYRQRHRESLTTPHSVRFVSSLFCRFVVAHPTRLSPACMMDGSRGRRRFYDFTVY
eukprot:Selendium_serpulae@DN3640_c0_g1_i1.p1